MCAVFVVMSDTKMMATIAKVMSSLPMNNNSQQAYLYWILCYIATQNHHKVNLFKATALFSAQKHFLCCVYTMSELLQL